MWFFNKNDGSGAAIENTVKMVRDKDARRKAKRHGLDILDLTWEDTARFEGSCVGPNISDMTIQVERRCMPVIRYPNFTDRTADVRIDRFGLLVGNERGAKLKPVSLQDYLGNLRAYLSKPKSFKGKKKSLLADDTHVLVSAQSCFLPVPKTDVATFNPVLFNYQSYQNCPAVLAIVATREGTSATVIDNVRDGFGEGGAWGQRLFFNDDGERASFTGERVSEFRGDDVSDAVAPNAEHSLNAVLLIQVPLLQPEARQRFAPQMMACERAAGAPQRSRKSGFGMSSDTEDAVIGHGESEGPFTEIDGLAIERDPRYPIRVTVQLYRATSTGVLDDADAAAISHEISKIYADADFTGSLVVDPNRSRPTAPELGPNRNEPAGWWEAFWRRYESNTGQSREAALLMLWRVRGRGWSPNTKDELYRALSELD